MSGATRRRPLRGRRDRLPAHLLRDPDGDECSARVGLRIRRCDWPAT